MQYAPKNVHILLVLLWNKFSFHCTQSYTFLALLSLSRSRIFIANFYFRFCVKILFVWFSRKQSWLVLVLVLLPPTPSPPTQSPSPHSRANRHYVNLIYVFFFRFSRAIFYTRLWDFCHEFSRHRLPFGAISFWSSLTQPGPVRSFIQDPIKKRNMFWSNGMFAECKPHKICEFFCWKMWSGLDMVPPRYDHRRHNGSQIANEKELKRENMVQNQR